MNSSERRQPLRDPQQITLIMLNRFWLLSKTSFTLLFLKDNIKLDEMQAKIKLKMQACFTLYFQFWEGTSMKSYKIQLPVLLFLEYFLYLISFYISISADIIFLQLFRSSCNIIWKRFLSQFLLLTQTPTPLIAKIC